MSEVTKVSTKIINDLEKISSCRQYKKGANIIYKGHIPHCGFLLIEGEITLTHSKSKITIVHEGSLIGIKELMNSSPFQFNASIKPESRVYILDKSTVNEILGGVNTTLREIFFNEVG